MDRKQVLGELPCADMLVVGEEWEALKRGHPAAAAMIAEVSRAAAAMPRLRIGVAPR